MNGTQLALMYGLTVSKLKYCGPAGASDRIYAYLTGSGSFDEASALLRQFEGQYSYMKLIADCNGLDVNDYEVAEAYWLGNDLLKKVDETDLRKMMRAEFSKYLPQSRVAKLTSTMPRNCNAQHSFHVLHVRSVAGRVPLNELTPDNCIVSWGTVKELPSEGKAVVSRRPLMAAKNGLNFGEQHDDYMAYDPALVRLREGDTVSMHWQNVVQTITSRQMGNLKKYTVQNMVAVNSSPARKI